MRFSVLLTSILAMAVGMATAIEGHIAERSLGPALGYKKVSDAIAKALTKGGLDDKQVASMKKTLNVGVDRALEDEKDKARKLVDNTPQTYNEAQVEKIGEALDLLNGISKRANGSRELHSVPDAASTSPSVTEVLKKVWQNHKEVMDAEWKKAKEASAAFFKKLSEANPAMAKKYGWDKLANDFDKNVNSADGAEDAKSASRSHKGGKQFFDTEVEDEWIARLGGKKPVDTAPVRVAKNPLPTHSSSNVDQTDSNDDAKTPATKALVKKSAEETHGTNTVHKENVSTDVEKPLSYRQWWFQTHKYGNYRTCRMVDESSLWKRMAHFWPKRTARCHNFCKDSVGGWLEVNAIDHEGALPASGEASKPN